MFNITSVPLNYVNSNLYRLIDSYIIMWLEDYSVNQSFDWGQVDWERNGSLFYDEHKKYDKRIVAKAFVDAYIKLETNICMQRQI